MPPSLPLPYSCHLPLILLPPCPFLTPFRFSAPSLPLPCPFPTTIVLLHIHSPRIACDAPFLTPPNSLRIDWLWLGYLWCSLFDSFFSLLALFLSLLSFLSFFSFFFQPFIFFLFVGLVPTQDKHCQLMGIWSFVSSVHLHHPFDIQQICYQNFVLPEILFYFSIFQLRLAVLLLSALRIIWGVNTLFVCFFNLLLFLYLSEYGQNHVFMWRNLIFFFSICTQFCFNVNKLLFSFVLICTQFCLNVNKLLFSFVCLLL